MVITHIKGGLGNQLFQYAFGRFLAAQLNDVLYLDNTLFTSGQSWNRQFNLDKFGFKFEVATSELINQFEPNQKQSRFQRLMQKLHLFPSFSFVAEDMSRIDLSLKAKKGNIYLKGYWQNENYFKEIRKLLLDDWKPNFTLSETANNFKQLMTDSNSVCVHFRRGDYVTVPSINKTFGVLPIAYYETAISMMEARFPDLKLFVFSDDMDWVKSNLQNTIPTHFVDTLQLDYEELYLMTCCKHNIIANSSFSWWGAWLNNYAGKLVFAPDPWFINYPGNMSEIVSNEWIKIKY